MDDKPQIQLPVSEACGQDYLAQRSIFFFDNDANVRLAVVRMNFGWTQKQLAEKLGCSQSVVSDIEKGNIKFNEKITVWALQVALSKHWRFVVFQRNASAFNVKAMGAPHSEGSVQNADGLRLASGTMSARGDDGNY